MSLLIQQNGGNVNIHENLQFTFPLKFNIACQQICVDKVVWYKPSSK